MKVKLLLTAITLSCLAIDVLAQVSISGKIVSADTNEPIVGANIRIDQSLSGCTTNGKGEFSISNLPDGKHVLRVKRNAHTRVIARAAEAAVQAFLGPKVVLRYTNDAPTGYEAYWIVRAEARSVKRQMCGIEDFHPLGRLFDLDVIQSDATPLSRTDVGFAPRRCLLCDQEARWCMRNHTHTQEEILQRIDEMVREFNAEN